jgi:hypothetical protein
MMMNQNQVFDFLFNHGYVTAMYLIFEINETLV